MAKLNDTQLILLSAAAQREGGSVYPLPDALSGGADRAGKAVAALVKLGLAEERETSEVAQVCRTDGDIGYGIYATEAGIAALDSGEGEVGAVVSLPGEVRVTKSSVVVTLLQRGGGATLAELIEATDWLPHTTRAALTGLRKKGHVVERGKRGDATCYHIAA